MKRFPRGWLLAMAGITWFLAGGQLDRISVAGDDTFPGPARVQELAALLPDQPQGVGRPISDRTAWQHATGWPGLKAIVAQAEHELTQPIPELTEALYLDYSKTGNRDRCQRVIFQRHGRVSTLVLAECVENQGRFLPALEEAIRAVCSEPSWLLPAHDRGNQNYYGKTVEIDLSSAATSWNLATARAWFGERLSSEVRQLIAAEVERRTLTPFESYVRTGQPRLWWPTGTNNWNAVCLAGVTGSALAVIESPQRRAFFVAAAERYVQHFLEGFTSDGYCSEGMGYWNYGFGHYVLLAETIHQATGGRVDLLADPRVRAIAQFGPRMEIVPGVYPAFADCSPRAQPDEHILAYVNRRYGFAWEGVEPAASARAGSSRGLFDLAVYDFPNSVSQRPAGTEAKPAHQLRDWFADAGILICRPRADNRQGLGVALKGGHNAEHHNHNDVGSFVVAVAGETPLLDPGSEVYTARTFSSRRYESQVLNSYGHPVPLVAGQLQRTGRQAEARVLKTEFTDEQDTLVLDLCSAYAVEGLQKLERTFVFSRQGRGSLTVTDEVEFASPQTFGTALVTFSPPRKIDGRRLAIGDGAAAVLVEATAGDAGIKVREEELHEDVHSPRLPVRLGIDVAQPVTRAKLALTICPTP